MILFFSLRFWVTGYFNVAILNSGNRDAPYCETLRNSALELRVVVIQTNLYIGFESYIATCMLNIMCCVMMLFQKSHHKIVLSKITSLRLFEKDYFERKTIFILRLYQRYIFKFSQLTHTAFSRPYPPKFSRLFLQIAIVKRRPSETRPQNISQIRKKKRFK